MAKLLLRPTGPSGKVHDVTPGSAGWGYVGFGLFRLAPGETASEPTGAAEVILVLVEGKARVAAAGLDFGELGDRADVFEATPPHSVYVPPGATWTATATTACTLAACAAPGKPGRAAQVIGPEGVGRLTRGAGANTRHIHPIAMEERDVADSLLVTEVYTPQGNWSS